MELENVDRDIGNAVRLARVSKDKSQEDLAAEMTRLGYPVSQATIGKIERGERKVTVGEATALAQALGMRSVLDLTQGESSLRLLLMLARLDTAREDFRAAGARMIDDHLELARTASELLIGINATEDQAEVVRYELLSSVLSVAIEIQREAILRLESDRDLDLAINQSLRSEILRAWKEDVSAWERIAGGEDAGNG